MNISNQFEVVNEALKIKDSVLVPAVHYQDISTINNLQTALDDKLPYTLKGTANGLAELDSTGFVKNTQLPSYVDDVLEFANYSTLPVIGETGKIYITVDNNKTFRWSGSIYAEISSSLALGETSATAYRGDRGKIAFDKTAPLNVTETTLTVDRDLHVEGNITASKDVIAYVAGAVSSDVLNNLTAAAPLYKPSNTSVGLKYNGTQLEVNASNELQIKSGILAPAAHSHLISDVTALQATLDSKAPASGSGNYIQNQNVEGQNADYNILGLAKSRNIVVGAVGYSGIPFEIQSSAGANAIKIIGRSDNLGFIEFYKNDGTTLIGDIYGANDGLHFDGAATFASTIQATTAKLTNLTDGYIPYHISDASGLGNSPIYTDGNDVAITNRTFKVQKDEVLASSNNGQIRISGLTDPNLRLNIGFDTSDQYGYLQATNTLSAYKNLSLNPLGGNVGIGYSTGTEITNNKLAVNGSGYFNTGITAKTLTLNSDAILKFINPINTSAFDVGLLGGGSDANAYIYQRANSSLIFGTNNTERFRINADGTSSFQSTINSTGYLLNNNNLFSSLSTGYLPYWDGGKFVNSNVDNTSDANKPVSTAQQTAINAVQTNLNSHTGNGNNPHSVTKAQVGLSNVTNESKATMFNDSTLTGVSKVSNLTYNSTTQTIKQLNWSRIVDLNENGLLGTSFIVTISGTRSSVVWNVTAQVTTSHNACGYITILNSSNYSQVKLRLVTNYYGGGFLEIYDNNTGAALGVYQTINISIENYIGTSTILTAFQDGTATTGYTVLPEINSIAGGITTQGAVSATNSFELKNAAGAVVWNISVSGTDLVFKNSSGVNKAKIDQNGNLTTAGELTAYGTI